MSSIICCVYSSMHSTNKPSPTTHATPFSTHSILPRKIYASSHRLIYNVPE
jgi:hypothetical protein